MQKKQTNQNGYQCTARRIQFFLFLLLTVSPSASLSSEIFQGKLEGVTITGQNQGNTPPSAVITYTQSGNTVTFDGSGSADSDGSIVQYKWDFGDGGTATTAVAPHHFAVLGTPAKVTLQTVDDKGAVALSHISFVVPVVYEDAEDGTIGRWNIYDNVPEGAIITNEYDNVRQSRVINLQGTTEHGFSIKKSGASPWNNTKNFIIQWSYKYSNDYLIYVDCQSSAGHRWLKYTYENINRLGTTTSETVEHGLGLSTKDGQWHTITRDLQADLHDAQPGVNILSVNGINIRGAGRWDDIMLK